MPAQATRMALVPPPERAEEAAPEIDREEVTALAYSLWQKRGCPEGSPDEDWYRAEADLRRRREAAE